MLINLILMAFAGLMVHCSLRRDLDKGVATAVFFLVFLPKEVVLQIPGALPSLTAHRVVLLVLLFHLFPRIRREDLAPVSRPILILMLVALCRLCSTATAVDAAASLKVVLGFLIETVLYFVLIVSALRRPRAIEFVAWSSLLALVLVACIATVEKYTGRNLAAMVIDGMDDWPNTVSATFRHRILLGYAMAMGFPLAAALRARAQNFGQRWLARMAVLLVPAACYYANSRGPWVGCALAAMVMFALGDRAVRRTLRTVGILAVLVLTLRPGTYETIHNLWEQSFNQNTIKGHSTDYRLILWDVAYSELTKSLGHTVFGYGGHSTELLDVSEYFDRGAGGNVDQLGFSSWDSQYASNFMQYGFLGFGLELIFYFLVVRIVVRTARAQPAQRGLAVACAATVLVFFWAMATVAIFNPQLEYLLWAAVGISISLQSAPVPVAVPQGVDLNVAVEPC